MSTVTLYRPPMVCAHPAGDNSPRLGELLVEKGLVTQENIDAALEVQRTTNIRLGKILLCAGKLSAQALNELLSFKLNVPLVHLADQLHDEGVKELVPLDFMVARGAVPFIYSHNSRQLHVAFDDPTEAKINDFETAFKVWVIPYLAAPDEIKHFTYNLYNQRSYSTIFAVGKEGGNRLGDLLIQKQIISQGDLEEALAQQELSGERIGTVLVKMGIISEAILTRVLSQQLQVPTVSLSTLSINGDLRKFLNLETSCEYDCVPFLVSHKTLSLAFEDAPSENTLQAIEAECGLKIEPFLASRSNIRTYRSSLYEMEQAL